MKEFGICIVGDLRTFGMPAIRQGIFSLQQTLNADVFFDVKYRDNDFMNTSQYRVREFTSGKKCIYTHENILEMVKPFRAKDIMLSNMTWCSGTESSQYEMLHRCFTKAMSFSYQYFIRVRPDFYISPSTQLRSNNFKCAKCTIMSTNSDIFFVMNRFNMKQFLSHTDLLYPSCGGGCCLDYHPKLFNNIKQLKVDGGLVRDSILIRGTTNKVNVIKNAHSEAFTCRGIFFSGKKSII